MKRLASAPAMIPAAWLALTLVAPTPVSSAAQDNADTSYPINESTQLRSAHDGQLREGF